jgi:hypothetical protein
MAGVGPCLWRRIPKFETEDVDGCNEGSAKDLDAALAEARGRGVNRPAKILPGPEMLSASEFAKFIGASREAVRAKHHRHEVLGLVTRPQRSGREKTDPYLPAISERQFLLLLAFLLS